MKKPVRYGPFQGEKRLRRFFSTDPLLHVQQKVFLSDRETHHLRDILRLSPGDSCLLTDGRGQEAEARIFELSGGKALLLIHKLIPAVESSHYLKIRILQSLAGKGKLDFLIEKLQELGVAEFWPVETERSSARLNESVRGKVIARWGKKTIEAAKQSGAKKLMRIEDIHSLEKSFVRLPQTEIIYCFHPDNNSKPFRQCLMDLNEHVRNKNESMINFIFGPEGGFSQREVTWMRAERIKQGAFFEQVSLGPDILRLETAVLGVTAATRFMFP